MVSSMSGSPQGHIRVVFHQFLLELANLTTSFNHNFSTQATEVRAGDVWNEQVAFYHSITLRGGQLQKGESQKSLETSNLNRYGGCELACMCDFTLSYDCCAVNVPLPLTDTVQLPVNGPCKSRYLAINVICTTVLSLNIQLYNCIAVFPRLHPNTTYMPNTDDTDYTDNRVVFIIWTDNVNAICTTTISSDIQLWYCIAVFPRLYPSNTYLPNTDYTDYTDNRVVFIIWTDNVNAQLTYHCR